MKYIVLLGDGMADEPIAELGMKTPLECANTPNMDRIAARGHPGPGLHDPGRVPARERCREPVRPRL